MTKEQIYKWRKRKQLTQEQAAKFACCSKRCWQYWEAGQRKIPNYLPTLLKSYS